MLAACNPFVKNYSGEKWPAVKTATVVMTPPDPASGQRPVDRTV